MKVKFAGGNPRVLSKKEKNELARNIKSRMNKWCKKTLGGK